MFFSALCIIYFMMTYSAKKYNFQYKHFKMKGLFYGIFLLVLTQCVRYRRLTTDEESKSKSLSVGDELISTMGIFKAILQKSGCTLRIQIFNNNTNKYDFKGKYNSGVFTKDCSRLDITQGKLVTQTGIQYLSCFNQGYNHSTVFTIDDLGVMRLISTYNHENRRDLISTENQIRTFYTQHKYILAVSQLQIDFMNKFGPLYNERDWAFLCENGQLNIYMADNPNNILSYSYSQIIIRNTRIHDFSYQTFPAVLFNNLTYQPRCNQPAIYIDYKPPYVFYAHPYWPIVTVFQQGGYKVIQLAYGNFPQYQVNQNISQINFYHYYSPCPRKTFEHKGDCLSSCPPPFYHLIKGQSGFCVLNCEQFSKVDQSKRVCSCVTSYEFDKLSSAKLVTRCPSNAVQTPYGCQCKTAGQFYDSKYSFTCVTNCPSEMVGINKVCMTCPQNCLICKKDNFYRQFLQCTKCKPGYTISKGQCIDLCDINYGVSKVNNQLCLKCEDPNCVNCSANSSVCLKCGILWTLYDGRCYDNCQLADNSGNSVIVYTSYFNSVCITKDSLQCINYLPSQFRGVPFLKCDECLGDKIKHLSQCVDSCPSGYRQDNGYCVCSGTTANLTVNNLCLNLRACPIGMSFDLASYSCISCPFGCISCTKIKQCTACNPGYFLFVSPQIISCRKKSPLHPCEKQYSWQHNSVCTLKKFEEQNQMQLCFNKVPNCLACAPASLTYCVVCNENFYIYNNTCISQCPNGLIKYQQTCILPQIESCSVPHLLSIHQYSKLNLSMMQASQSYKNYIYFGQEAGNDPMGYVPRFQANTGQHPDGSPRYPHFFQPIWICLKCQNGFGLTQNFEKCIPCPSQCKKNLCYMARPDSCLGQQISVQCGLYQFIDEQTKTCLKSCNSSQKFPEIRQGKLYCVSIQKSVTKDYMRIDSAFYKMADNRNLIFFVFSQKVSQNAQTVDIQSFRNFNVSKQKVNNKLLNQNQNSKQIILKKSALGVSQILQSSPSRTSSIINGQFVALQRQQDQAYVIDFKTQLLTITGAESPIIFPSTLYGTVYKADHTVFMTTWLAYIGYIMSIVIILLHAVFIGNQLLYKVDNLLIFVQTIYYFSYVKNLVGRLLAQFYFGWSFSHARFLPNVFNGIIPDHYVQMRAPVSYKLVNIDGNYFRNAGFSLFWLLVYVGAWAIVTFVIWVLFNQLCKKKQSWYPRVASQSLAGALQFFAMNLMFFSVSQLAYSSYPEDSSFQGYYNRSQVLAIVTIVFLSLYGIVRFFVEPIGGLYMVKRLAIAVILVFGYDYVLLLIPLICLQVLFSILRHVIQRPFKRFQKISIWGQCILIIGCYFLLWFCLDAGVNIIIISVLVFVFIVYLAYDLTTLYLQSLNQFPQQQLAKEYEQLTSEANKQRAMTVNYVNGNKNVGKVNSRGVSSIMELT